MFKFKSVNFSKPRNAPKPLFVSSFAASPAINLDDFQPQFQPQPTLIPTSRTQIQDTHFFRPSSDPRSFISALIQCRSPTQIKQVHAQAISTSMIENLGVANKLVYIYTQHRALGDAHSLFLRMKERDNVSWSVMVGGFAKIGDYENCLETFREFIRSGSRIDNYTLPFALRACRDTQAVNNGLEIHHLIYKAGLSSDCFVLAALVDMYARCGHIEDARKVFDKMWMKDLVTWTVMIAGYAECGNPEESLVLFDRMKEEGVVPDKVTMVTVAFACSKLGAMHKAKMVHDYVLSKKHSYNVILGTAMIDMYAKCGSVDVAREIFDCMKERNVITVPSYRPMKFMVVEGRPSSLFSQMLESGIRPNRITFVSIFSSCSHAGLVDEGQKFFQLPGKADLKHYTCIVDLFGRAGRLSEAVELIDGMRVEKDEGFWGCDLRCL